MSTKITYNSDVRTESESIIVTRVLESKYLPIEEVVRIAMKIPFEKLPQHTNDGDEIVRAIVKSRLEIGK